MPIKPNNIGLLTIDVWWKLCFHKTSSFFQMKNKNSRRDTRVILFIEYKLATLRKLKILNSATLQVDCIVAIRITNIFKSIHQYRQTKHLLLGDTTSEHHWSGCSANTILDPRMNATYESRDSANNAITNR